MDGPIDWWWKMNLLDVCVQAGFYEIRSHISFKFYLMQNDYCYVYAIAKLEIIAAEQCAYTHILILKLTNDAW